QTQQSGDCPKQANQRKGPNARQRRLNALALESHQQTQAQRDAHPLKSLRQVHEKGTALVAPKVTATAKPHRGSSIELTAPPQVGKDFARKGYWLSPSTGVCSCILRSGVDTYRVSCRDTCSAVTECGRG